MLPIDAILLSYHVTEESGGPAVAAAGFARELARRGHRVTLLALDSRRGRWLLDERDPGLTFRFERIRGATWFERRVSLRERALEVVQKARNPLVWANGIWGVQSLAGCDVSRLSGAPLVVRPAGSLGRAAMQYKRLKKLAYLGLVELPVLRLADRIHCMSDRELAELPEPLKAKAFLAPTGVDLPAAGPSADRPEVTTVGVLARIHPIKRQHLALEAVESLLREGRDIRLELAGSISDEAYLGALKRRVESSQRLRGRVSFLGHVSGADVAKVVGRWSAALLLSEQENFGHAVLSVAALGVPSVVTEGVGLACALARAGAGRIVEPSEAANALREVLSSEGRGLSDACRAFAAQYSWEECGRMLESELSACIEVRRGRGTR